MDNARKNDVQNVHRQPAHKLTNDDATDELLLWRLRDPGWTTQHAVAASAKYHPSVRLVHCDGASQKLGNQMQNYLKYTNTPQRVAPFFLGNVIYDFWTPEFYKIVYRRM